MKADVIGLQEVVFGPAQLDEIKVAHGAIAVWDPVYPEYEALLAPAQFPNMSFKLDAEGVDPDFKIDGNAVLLAPDLTYEDYRILHLSAEQCAQLVKIPLPSERYLFFVNVQLAHASTDKVVNRHQAEQLIAWVELQEDYRGPQFDLICIAGDFNSLPSSETYQAMISRGYTSCFKETHGSEPEYTFPSGIDAPFLRQGPPGCLDYIFIKGQCDIAKCEVWGEQPLAIDKSIYGSDHIAIIV